MIAWGGRQTDDRASHWVIDAIDDMRALPAAPRLALQCVAAGVLVAAPPQEMQASGCVSLLDLCGSSTWSISWTASIGSVSAETVPVTGAIFLIGLLGGVGTLPTLAVAALLGAFLGFDPFNILF